uniref:SRC kinase signaling inhibitor 1 n=1 Tax=Macrostomum lignano TaxID=282301 RepID=A0A1I8FBR0_9PLAT
RFGRLVNELHPDGRGAAGATDRGAGGGGCGEPRHDLALLRTDFEELRQSCRHCLHSVDQMFTRHTGHCSESQRQSKNLRRDSSPRPHSQERLKAYRLESRAIDTRLFELEQLVEELRSGTHPAGSESAAQRSATAAAAASATQQLQVALTAARRSLETDVAAGVSGSGGCLRRRCGEFRHRIEPIRIEQAMTRCRRLSELLSGNARRPELQQQKSLGDSAQKLTGKSHAQLPAEIVSEICLGICRSVHRRWPSTSAGISVAISAAPPSPPPLPLSVESAEPLPRINATRQSQPPPPRPRPQVAFSDTVKVDDGSQVIKLNWADASEPAAAAATASAAKSPTSGSPRTPPRHLLANHRPEDRGDVIAARRPGSRQRPSDYENVVGRVRPGSQAEEDAEQVWQRQSTVHFRSRSDSDRHRASGSATAAAATLAMQPPITQLNASVVHSLKGSRHH